MNDKQAGRIVALFSESVFERFIPQKALQLFPLKAEPISCWNSRNLDLKQFLKYICDKDAQVTYADGIPQKVNYRSYWKTLFTVGITQFQSTAKEFKKEAESNTPMPGSVIQTVRIPSFTDDKYYGLMAKHYACYNGLINTALSDNQFFSVENMIESQQELDCSILLAQSLYYKQAIQVLRNFIELVVIQILFCHDSSTFDAWRNGTFEIPRLRGDVNAGKGRRQYDGLLKWLAKEDLISQDLEKNTSSIYRKLNSYIHSMEANLVHRGTYKGEYRGFIFDYDYFKTWCNSFSTVVENGILLLDAHLRQVANMKRPSGIVCDVCHNRTKFRSEKFEFAGTEHVRMICEVCGGNMTVRP